MNAITTSYNNNISYGSNSNGVRQRDNSTQLALEGTAGMAAFGTIRNSSKIGKNVVSAIKTSKMIKADKQAKLLKLAGDFKPLAKYINNPVVKGVAGALAGLSAATALVGSTAKIADTCSYLQGINPNNN